MIRIARRGRAGPGCEEAVRTLLLGEGSTEPIGTGDAEFVFRDLSAAWEYVSKEIDEMMGQLPD